VVDKCAKDQADRATLKGFGLTDEKVDIIFPQIQGFAPGCPLDQKSLDDVSEIEFNSLNDFNLERESPVTPTEASPFVIPKQRTFNPGDGYPNRFQIQRDLRAISVQL